MGNIFTEIASASSSLSLGAYKVASIANAAAALGVLGTIAQVFSANQPLLNAAFGQARGASISLIAIAISHLATTVAAYGAPAGGGPPTTVHVMAAATAEAPAPTGVPLAPLPPTT